jgi:hypothetical protein
MNKRFVVLLSFASVLLAGTAAMAQEAPPAGGGGGGVQSSVTGEGASRTQTFNFTDELVSGQLVRPDGESSRIRRRGSGISLIRIREHFVPEMLKSVENL